MSLDEELLQACSELNFDQIKELLADNAEPGYQDPTTGHGPLHKAVIAAKEKGKEDAAQEIIEYILANGGVWMQGQIIPRNHNLIYSGSK
jgi:ankyrin repeat protein